MKIYSDTLTSGDVAKAARIASVGFADTYIREGWFVPIHEFTPRKRFARGFTVYLTGSSVYASAHERTEKAATWDEHGEFMAELFRIDPDAEISFYRGLADFLAQTRKERERVQRNFSGDSLYARTHKAPWIETLKLYT